MRHLKVVVIGGGIGGLTVASAAKRAAAEFPLSLASRAQGRKNHLTSPWARLRRDLVYRFRTLINPQSTGLKAGWVYEYDAASVELELESAAAD